jgi:hypothetical protein
MIVARHDLSFQFVEHYVRPGGKRSAAVLRAILGRGSCNGVGFECQYRPLEPRMYRFGLKPELTSSERSAVLRALKSARPTGTFTCSPRDDGFLASRIWYVLAVRSDSGSIDLDVPPSERSRAERAGAQWSDVRGCWYAHGPDMRKCAQWHRAWRFTTAETWIQDCLLGYASTLTWTEGTRARPGSAASYHQAAGRALTSAVRRWIATGEMPDIAEQVRKSGRRLARTPAAGRSRTRVVNGVAGVVERRLEWLADHGSGPGSQPLRSPTSRRRSGAVERPPMGRYRHAFRSVV